MLGADIPEIFVNASYYVGLVVLVLIGVYLVYFPLRNAGKADEPPPPSAVV